MPLTTGARLGPYEIAAALGAGGMGEVYRATDTRLGRDVAVKILPADVASDPDRLARFEREARAVSALNHPNIVTLYEVGTSEAGPYLVLEKIEGRSLRDLLADGPLPIRRVLTLAAQIAEGVAKAHAAGIVHRDLKPDNIMVTEDGFAKVLDFGLAKLVWPELGAAPIAETTLVKETGSGVVLGTLGYLSPEQAAGKPADYRADQFALGALMYEMATRDRPFKRETMLESLTATIRDEPEPVRSKRADVPAPLEWIIERCLQKDPNDRYASTSDLARDLASMRDRLSDLTRGPGIEAPGRTRVAPRGLAGWSIAAALLATIGIGGYFLGRQASPAPDSAPAYRPLTFQRGVLTGARFGSDGKTVYYSTALGDGPSRVYVTRLDRADSRLLDHIPPAFLMAVSANEDLLVLLTSERSGYTSPGTLAQVPAVGGTPRELVEGVVFGDWSSDGKRIAVTRQGGGCEFPVGRPIVGPCGFIRLAPSGDSMSYYAAQQMQVRDAQLQQITTSAMPHSYGLAWSRDGREVWFTGSENGTPHDRALYALSLDGRRRLLARAPGSLVVWDVGQDRRSALVSLGASWTGVTAAVEGAEERSLDYLGRTEAVGLSADGKWALLNEVRDEGRGAYLQSTDGRQRLPISDEIAHGLSPDGSTVLVHTRERTPRLKLVPARAGSARDVALMSGWQVAGVEPAQWSRDGRRLFMWLSQTDPRTSALHVRDEAGTWRAVTPLVPAQRFAVSPDGSTVAVNDRTGTVRLFPVDGGESKPVEGERGRVMHWTRDNSLVLAEASQFPARLYKRNLLTGRVEPWRTIGPTDSTGVTFVSRILFADDDKSHIYGHARAHLELFLAFNLH